MRHEGAQFEALLVIRGNGRQRLCARRIPNPNPKHGAIRSNQPVVRVVPLFHTHHVPTIFLEQVVSSTDITCGLVNRAILLAARPTPSC